jgi:hypothetical protein
LTRGKARSQERIEKVSAEEHEERKPDDSDMAGEQMRYMEAANASRKLEEGVEEAVSVEKREEGMTI